MHIVYVEDNPANLALVQRVARLGRHEVASFTNGEEALQSLTSSVRRPDLLLVDIQLDGAMSGLDLMARLREEGFDMPIIAVTAYAMLGDKERCLEAGFTGYLPKPLPVMDLIDLFKQHSDPMTTA
ncbi:MAG: response regulator [Anaerolineae bacterium]|nr:response regulator [Anaerolineae bacterium]